jgi:large subunit ribosomal protein L25
MEEVVLELKPREVIGKAVKHLRVAGTVPAVIHDHGKDSILVMGPYPKIVKVYQQAGKHHPVHLTVDGKKYVALIKDVDIDPKKHVLRHVVFNAVTAHEKVTAQIPVHIRFDEGNDATPAERNGLIVLHNIDSVEVEATATNLPDALAFDGEKLIEIGDHVTVADLIVPEGVEIKAEPTQTLATVFEPSALQAANDAAGGTADEDTAEVTGEEGAEAAPGEETKETAGDEKKSE